MAIRSLNKITLMGYLGKKPELIVTPKANGGEIKRVSARLATNESIPDGNGGYIEETDWHNIVFWGRDAEIISQYGSTKTPIYIEGTVKNRSYEKNGQLHYVSEIRVNEFIMLGSKPSDDPAAFGMQPPVAAQQAQQQQHQQPPQAQQPQVNQAIQQVTGQPQQPQYQSQPSASSIVQPAGTPQQTQAGYPQAGYPQQAHQGQGQGYPQQAPQGQGYPQQNQFPHPHAPEGFDVNNPVN